MHLWRLTTFLFLQRDKWDRKCVQTCSWPLLDPSAYKLLKNLCQPDDPNTKTYQQMKNLLRNHYEPAPIVIAERHRFWSACQGEQEGVADFVVRLKKLGSTCAFGAFLQEALRDRLVSGLHSKMSRSQRHLLTVRDLNFQTARDRCVGDEMAGLASKEHLGEVVDTNKVFVKSNSKRKQYGDQKGTSSSTDTSSKSKDRCFRCGA